jgi:hypothetical protein
MSNNSTSDFLTSFISQPVVAKPKRRKIVKDWQCNECLLPMTFKTAERAVYGDGCPKCGGADIFIR